MTADRSGVRSGRAGLFALIGPLFIIAVTLGSMDSGVAGLVDPSTSLLAGLMFLVALPSTWVFAVLDIAPVFSVVLGCVSSLPLWFGMGSWLAAGSYDWAHWTRRYVAWSVGWAVTSLVLLLTVASILG